MGGKWKNQIHKIVHVFHIKYQQQYKGESKCYQQMQSNIAFSDLFLQ